MRSANWLNKKTRRKANESSEEWIEEENWIFLIEVNDSRCSSIQLLLWNRYEYNVLHDSLIKVIVTRSSLSWKEKKMCRRTQRDTFLKRSRNYKNNNKSTKQCLRLRRCCMRPRHANWIIYYSFNEMLVSHVDACTSAPIRRFNGKRFINLTCSSAYGWFINLLYYLCGMS